MSDIFVSYSHFDRPHVSKLVKAFEARGWNVFWDPEIDPGNRWDAKLRAQLSAAKCIVVVWTRNSTASHWVNEEAHYARENKKLVPVAIDMHEPPAGYRLIQTVFLNEWDGNEHDIRLLRLMAAVEEMLATAPNGTSSSNVRQPSEPSRPSSQEIPATPYVAALTQPPAKSILTRLRNLLSPRQMAMPSPAGGESDVYCAVINNEPLLRSVNIVVREVFGEATIDDAEVIAKLKKNPRASIALVSKRTGAAVGFASFWPITEEFATGLMRGSKHEIDLSYDDILADTEIHRAKYIYVPGIAVLDYNTRRGKIHAAYLMRGFLRFIRRHYLAGRQEKLTILAFGFTDHGKKWAEKLHFRVIGHSQEYGQSCPLYMTEWGHDEIENIEDHIFDQIAAGKRRFG